MFLPAQAYANMGLQATFWDNQTDQDNQYNDAPPYPPTTPIVASIPVATVDQDFDMYPPAGVPADDFVVKYEGYITATESGTVNIQCLADDGCIVIIDGNTVISEWWDKGTSGDVYQYTLVPGQSLPFIVWYYENGGGAVIQLRWQFPDRDWEVVPGAVFSTAPKEVPPVIVETPTVVEEVVQPAPPPPPPPPVVVPPPPAVEPEPPVVIEEPPAVEPEPPAVEPEPPAVVEEPPLVEEEPPAVEEEPPPIEEEPPAVVEEPPVVVPEPVAPVQQPTVTLDNGVVLTQEVAVALELFNNPAELLSEVFSNPGAVLTAFSNIGADMSVEVRDKAEKTIVAAVIVGQIATQSAVTAAAGAASYRRKP